MKFSTAVVISAAAAFVSATDVIYDPDTNTWTCSIPDGVYCAGDSLGTNIIIRCNGTVGQPGNCNANLSGQPPLGSTPTLCYEPQHGVAACVKNCVVYGGSGNIDGDFTLPADKCTPTYTATTEEPTTTAPPPTTTDEPVEPTTTTFINPPTTTEVPCTEEPNETCTDEPVEPTHTDEPVEPTHTDEPVEPTHTDEPVEPTHTDEPVEPTHTDEPVEPTHTHEPVEPTHTHEPVEPTHTHEPVEPTHTHEPVEPTHTNEPVEPTSVPVVTVTVTVTDCETTPIVPPTSATNNGTVPVPPTLTTKTPVGPTSTNIIPNPNGANTNKASLGLTIIALAAAYLI